MRRFLFLIAVLFVSACAPSSVGDLRNSPGGHRQFVLDENYQETYRNLARLSRMCWTGSNFAAPHSSQAVEADLYTDIGVGEITWRLINVTSHVFMQIDIKKLSQNKTQIDVYSFVTTKANLDRVERWAREKPERCGVAE